MIITTSGTITINLILEAGEVTTYAGKSNQFHVLLKNEDTSQIITEELGNPFTIVDSSLTSDGSITVDVDILDGYNRLIVYFADNADLDAGSTTIEKLASGFARKIIDETTLIL